MDSIELLKSINIDNWRDIVRELKHSYNDPEVISYFREHEEEILEIILGKIEDIDLQQKRNLFIRILLDDNMVHISNEEVEDMYAKVYEEIQKIREEQGASILEFQKLTQAGTHRVFCLGNKIIKFGKTFRIIKDPNILQPEFEMQLGDERRMTVFERVTTVFKDMDREISQEMYNRLRDRGIMWLDVHGDNVGRTEHRRDENDDGLRIIDAECMEYERSIIQQLQPEKNEKYKEYGIGAYDIALLDYARENRYGAYEEAYQKMCEERWKTRNVASKEDVEKVADKASMSGIKRVMSFLFEKLFSKGER